MIPRVLFVLGCPASGKGTVCSTLTSNYPSHFVHLSAGELLRQCMKGEDTERSQLIKKCMTEGKIVPVKITVGLLLDEIFKKRDTQSLSKVVLLDGYPRNADNVQGWNEVVGEKCEVLGVLHFVCSFDTIKERILGRVEETKARGEEVRYDDTEEVLKKRFVGHEKDTLPIINAFKEQNKCWDIDAEQNRENVYSQSLAAIRTMVKLD